ncbi:MAG: hypothetical protein LJE67_06150 [Salaquimonas sp.]|nr:hypothetical protein [Salaquimonas sp.]
MRLRVIDFGFVPAIRSQAIYHGVARALKRDDEPVLTLVNPLSPYVCVGVHQEIDKEVDEVFCKQAGLPVIRRHVGGGAVYLDENQMFFHFMFPREMVPQYAVNLYPKFIEPAVRTYRELGVNAEYRPVNDIQVAGRKIGGTGAASIGVTTVMVGSFMFDFDTATMAQCLKVPSEKFRDKLRQTLDDYMSTMTRELDVLPTREEVREKFLKHVGDVFGLTPELVDPTPAELAAIEAEEKALSDPAWTYRKGRKLTDMGVKISEGRQLTESMHKVAGGLIRTHLLAHDGVIENLMISGDFTCLPEDGVDRLAAALTGAKLEEAPLTDTITTQVKQLGLDMPGVEPADIAAAIMLAAGQDG